MTLRKGQRELVEQYRGGYCAIPAIPGGGKTHCLSLWTVEMIAQGLHKPGKILIVTYMNSAVNNFKQRISRELSARGIDGSKEYFVSTIHGLCMQIIREKPDFINADEEFEIIDGISKLYMINAAIEEWRKSHDDRFRYYLEKSQLKPGNYERTARDWQEKLCAVMAGAIGEFKCRGLSPQEAREKCEALPWGSLLKEAAEIYGLYDRRLKMGGFLDFDDMLFNAKKLLEDNPGLLDKFRKRYTFVCEDEAQDSNLIQNEILTMIANGNLLRVGDSNQAICGTFTNSDFTLFKNFCGLPQTTVYNITQSSRSTRDIINLANHFVRYVNESHPVAECRNSLLPQYIEPVGEDDERRNPSVPEYGIRVGIFKSWDEEIGSVVRHACHMLHKYPDKTVAILIPSSWKISQAVSLLESRNIPYEELENTSSQKNRALKMLGAVIDFLSAPESGDKLARVMSECFSLGEEISGFLKNFPTEKLLYPSGGEIDTADIPGELLKSKAWDNFVLKLDLVRELLEYPIMRV